MGNSYTNITLSGPAAIDIRTALAELKLSAYVSPTVDDFTVICDRNSDLIGLDDDGDDGDGGDGYDSEDDSDLDEEEGLPRPRSAHRGGSRDGGEDDLDRARRGPSDDSGEPEWDELEHRWAQVAQQLSQRLSCVAWAVNIYDDDVFLYKLFENGAERDAYNSTPNYFEGEDDGPALGMLFTIMVLPKLPLPKFIKRWFIRRSTLTLKPPTGGDAATLCRLFGRADATTAVAAILKKPQSSGGNLAALAMTEPDELGKLDPGEMLGNKTEYIFEVMRHQDLVKALRLPDFAPGAGYRYVKSGDVNNPADWQLVGA
jgi:hypothetical protein